ncbi:hypothetical protein ABT336_01090 [Micromonospora sp. NPDC000207]|uniref:hypothetical protein n=1 Tax=Micromonospora sp. NPDC000207 TaxID=3154246 RepID=UPI00331C4033
MTGTPTTTCPDCSGLSYTIARCGCVSGGDQLVVDGAAYADEPYRDCRLCRGDGSVVQPCIWCGRTGVRRAELVVSVVNADTGAVASTRIRPGGIIARCDPDGVWTMPMRPVVERLAARVGALDVRPVSVVGADPDGTLVWLSRDWAPNLPVEQRHRIEAEALIRGDHSPWRVLVGRSTPPVDGPDPGRHLGWLCGVANLLHLDLVVEARMEHGQVAWDVRFEMPGGVVPTDPRHAERDLAAAVRATTVATATARLAEAGVTAPAYTVRSSVGVLPAPQVVDVAEVERWVRVDLGGGAGAQAIWRNGRWWHTPLREGNPVEELYEWDTGQVVRFVTPRLVRVTEPPEPAWWGAPIRHRECPDCRPDSRLRRCDCRRGDTDPDPDCPDCCGAGMAPGWGNCLTCGGTRRIHSAMTVTVTDLTRATHRLWQPAAGEPMNRVGTNPDGTPIFQVGEDRRVAGLAADFGVGSEYLTRVDDGHPVGQDLLDGTVTGVGPGEDPGIRHVEQTARRLPGARLIVLAHPPAAPPVADLIRVGTGLDLAVTVVARDHRLDAADPTRLHGVRWRVDVTSPAAPPDLRQPWWPSLEAAVADRFAHLGTALRESVPVLPTRPVPAPVNSAPMQVQDPTPALRRLAARHAGQVVAVRADRTGCRFWLAEASGPRALTEPVPLATALSVLRLA